jgi:hypothetical protein
MINILNELKRLIKNNNYTSDIAEIRYFGMNLNRHTNLELKKMLYIVDTLIELKDLSIFKNNVSKIDMSNQSLREYNSDYHFYVTIYLKDNSYLDANGVKHDKDDGVILGYGKCSMIYDICIVNSIRKLNYWCAPSLMEYSYFEPNWKKFKKRIKRYTDKLCI